MEGWLHMREEGGSWHQRWFVLKDGQLSYYKKRDDNVKGSYSVVDALVGNTCGIDGKKDFLFALQMPGKTVYLQGRSADEVNEWTTALARFTSSPATTSLSSSAPSPRKAATTETPPAKPMALARTPSQKDNLNRSQPNPTSHLQASIDAKPLPPVPQPSPRASEVQSAGFMGSITMRRAPTGEGDALDALIRTEQVLQRIIAAAGHTAALNGITSSFSGSPRDKPMLQRARDMENIAKQCELIVLRMLHTSPASSPPSEPSSRMRSISTSAASSSPSPQGASPPPSSPIAAHTTSSETNEPPQQPAAAQGKLPPDVAALRAELSTVKDRSLKAIRQLMDENTALKKKREELNAQVEKSKVMRDENAFLKSRLDMAVRKMNTKDEQVKKLREKLDEVQPGAAAEIISAVRDASAAVSASPSAAAASSTPVGSPPSGGSGSMILLHSHAATAPASTSSSGTSTPSTEVEKETAEWLGSVFKFLDDPKVARYSTMVSKDRSQSQPTSPREGDL